MMKRYSWLFLFLLLFVACADEGENESQPLPTPTTETVVPTTEPVRVDDNYLIIATDAPNPPFTDFNEFGEVVGFNVGLVENLVTVAGFEGAEFVVTPHEGVLELLATDATDDYDVVMSSLILPNEPQAGITYTLPYLEIGDVVVVLADNQTIQSYQDLSPEMLVSVVENSSGERAAQEIAGLSETLRSFDTPEDALQALLDEEVQAAIINNFSANSYATQYPEQLKVVGGDGRSAWLTSQQYSIALADDDTDLLTRLNEAIATTQTNGVLDRLVVAWLNAPQGQIDPGQPRIGSPLNELVIGMVGEPPNTDPADNPNLVSWEFKANTMSGLYRIDSNNNLVPMLASANPAISADRLEYTIPLQQDLIFADGSAFTANDVKWSLDRSAQLGNFLVNSYLKDADGNGFADADAVQVIDTYTVKIVLQQPTSFFQHVLTTPPYFPISERCYPLALTADSLCGGIGPYTIDSYSSAEIRLRANPQWPGTPPATFENITLRFFSDEAAIWEALNRFQSIDMAWVSPFAPQLQTVAEGEETAVRVWDGAQIFKSYLVFEQSTPPWDSVKVRQAASLAVDQTALADLFGGARTPLRGPVPSIIPESAQALPVRDLARARALLLEEGYSEANPLAIDLWFISDGRYSPIEDQYAALIASQLEETGVFQVTLNSAPWDSYRQQMNVCNYPLYLMGWPSPGTPPNDPHLSAWTDYFVSNTSVGICSNYESVQMETLLTQAQTATDEAARTSAYAQLQTLWAQELPTLSLTQQEPRRVVSLTAVEGVRIDLMGLLHYETLTK